MKSFTTSRGLAIQERDGMSDALKRLKARRVRPTEQDAPPLSTFPGTKHKPLAGQMTLEEGTPKR